MCRCRSYSVLIKYQFCWPLLFSFEFWLLLTVRLPRRTLFVADFLVCTDGDRRHTRFPLVLLTVGSIAVKCCCHISSWEYCVENFFSSTEYIAAAKTLVALFFSHFIRAEEFASGKTWVLVKSITLVRSSAVTADFGIGGVRRLGVHGGWYNDLDDGRSWSR